MRRGTNPQFERIRKLGLPFFPFILSIRKKIMKNEKFLSFLLTLWHCKCTFTHVLIASSDRHALWGWGLEQRGVRAYFSSTSKLWNMPSPQAISPQEVEQSYTILNGFGVPAHTWRTGHCSQCALNLSTGNEGSRDVQVYLRPWTWYSPYLRLYCSADRKSVV